MNVYIYVKTTYKRHHGNFTQKSNSRLLIAAQFVFCLWDIWTENIYDIFLPSIFDRARNKVICGEWNLIRRDCGRYFQKVYFSQLFTELDKKQGAESFHQYTSLTCCLVHSASFRIQWNDFTISKAIQIIPILKLSKGKFIKSRARGRWFISAPFSAQFLNVCSTLGVQLFNLKSRSGQRKVYIFQHRLETLTMTIDNLKSRSAQYNVLSDQHRCGIFARCLVWSVQ